MSIDYSKMKPPSSGLTYVKFHNVGDTISGTIVTADEHQYDESSETRPRYGIRRDDTGAVEHWHVTQSNAYAQVYVLEPQINDHIEATFTGYYKASIGQGKNFAIKVTRPEQRNVV